MGAEIWNGACSARRPSGLKLEGSLLTVNPSPVARRWGGRRNKKAPVCPPKPDPKRLSRKFMTRRLRAPFFRARRLSALTRSGKRAPTTPGRFLALPQWNNQRPTPGPASPRIYRAPCTRPAYAGAAGPAGPVPRRKVACSVENGGPPHRPYKQKSTTKREKKKSKASAARRGRPLAFFFARAALLPGKRPKYKKSGLRCHGR